MTDFRVWAPGRHQVELVLDGTRVPMAPDGEHWFVRADGVDYGYSLDGGPVRPDPRSRWQPDGVHGLSRVYDDSAFPWSDEGWAGRPLADTVLYELHVGTFTAGGTFDSAIERLPHLADLGVTTIELLPCNAFDGRWGWGYDGVGWYAVHAPYGGPDGLKRFVDAAHAHGLGVAMDVVYNHLGPSGNYLPEFGPYLTDDHQTPWGAAVNLDRPGSAQVRRHILDNAVMWLRDFHLDGLRLDAVHALVDDSPVHLLAELAAEVEQLSADLGRPLWLVAESDLNDPVTVLPRPEGWGLDGQWCDDVHHALLALLTGEREGYYCDFGTVATMAKALSGAFVHDGTWSTFRDRPHGKPVPDGVPGSAFVVYLQDHDQVGNRALGDRPDLSPGLARIGAALVLLSPFTPMLFMGEEYGARTPWQFFSDHSGELGEAVRRGRRAEFASHGWTTDQVPDPQDPATVTASTLDWVVDEDLLDWHRSLLHLRRSHPDLSGPTWDRHGVSDDEDSRWLVLRRGEVVIACNLSDTTASVPLPGTPTAVLLSSTQVRLDGATLDLPPESVAIVELQGTG